MSSFLSNQPPRLGLNIDHVATLRNARGGAHPCPLDAAKMAIKSGVDGITAHLREDRRHMRDTDIRALQQLCKNTAIPLNMEMAATQEMCAIALEIVPHAVCIVPEKRQERTTEGGLNVHKQEAHFRPYIQALQNKGILVSLFIEANPLQIDASARLGANIVEFHTGAYAQDMWAQKNNQNQHIDTFKNCARHADNLKLEVHFGHGLDFENISAIASIREARELNIGHFLIGEAVFIGLEKAITQMRTRIRNAHNAMLSQTP